MKLLSYPTRQAPKQEHRRFGFIGVGTLNSALVRGFMTNNKMVRRLYFQSNVTVNRMFPVCFAYNCMIDNKRCKTNNIHSFNQTTKAVRYHHLLQ